jgi:hypothetical protein
MVTVENNKAAELKDCNQWEMSISLYSYKTKINLGVRLFRSAKNLKTLSIHSSDFIAIIFLQYADVRGVEEYADGHIPR